jgi:TonB-dependent receptor
MAQDAGANETVTVTGFRASLEKAMDLKRTALDSSDSIMAEDIAKFPDMNVTESLQRIPGVAITREAGEGREIVVRGLGASFTRVRINGMEALATGGGEDINTSTGNSGVNRGRGFDFNVFASELFQQLTVHKSNSADVEEGSLGATVDMHTAHPFDHPGFVFTAAAQAQYQEVADNASPRVSALISDTFLGGRLGVLVSGAYAISDTLEQGVSNIRTVNAINFGHVNGATSGADFTSAAALFHPRAARYDLIKVKNHRLGLTGSVQWQPDDATLFTLDAVYADFSQVRQESYMQGYSLNQNSTTTATKYPQVSSGTTCRFSGETCTSTLLTTLQLGNGYSSLWNYDPSDVNVSENFLQRAEMSNVGIRSQNRLDHLDTRFMQATLDGSHDFSENFKVHALVGWSESHHRNPIQETLSSDMGCVNLSSSTTCTNGGDGTQASPYIYDYSPGPMPMLNYGNVDVTTPAPGFYLSVVSGRATGSFNAYRTAQADFTWTVSNEVKIEGGVDYRNFGYAAQSIRRSNGSNSTLDSVLPYAQVASLKNINTPTVNGVSATRSWWVINIDKFNTDFHYFDKTAYPFTNDYATGRCKDPAGAATAASLCGAFQLGREPDLGNNGTVKESDYGGFLQADWETTLVDMPFRGNVGVRYVLTEAASAGFSYDAVAKSITVIPPIPSTYHDFLPSANLVLEPFESLLVRFNASYAMTRPSLSGMLPSGSPTVSGGQAGYSVGNPKLQPMRSKNLDLAFEWYYSKGAMLSIAGFWKHMDNVLMTSTQNWTFANNTLGLTDPSPFAGACGLTVAQWNAGTGGGSCTAGSAVIWKYTFPQNQKGKPLYGTEINWQQPLDFLPAPFDNMGVLGNFTYVQAQQQYPAIASGTFYTADLRGLSRTAYNGTIYYDDNVFQVRVTGAFRSHFLSDETVNTGNLGIYSRSTFNLDASASYKFGESLMFTLDAINLTNQAMEVYTDATYQRPYAYHETGRVFFAGVKYTY